MTGRSVIYLLLLLCALTSCEDDDDIIRGANQPDPVTGVDFVQASDGDFFAIYDSLSRLLTTNTNIGIVAEIDHRANAASTGEILPPTRVVLFGNPRLGTPLMQINQQAGLDLPQRMLVYQGEDGDVVVAYTTPEYLAQRHGVEAATTLPTIRTALENLATTAGGTDLSTAPDETVELNAGVVSYVGGGTVDSVYQSLRELIEDNANLTVVAELDHRANAASVGLDLAPTRLIVFGNPRLGTPLMQERRSTGIDLPQKMLVYQSADGEVTLCFNDPAYLAERHGIDPATSQLATIRMALDGLATSALGR